MTFRRRIVLAMVPLFVLVVALGVTGAVLIYHLGGQVRKILRENYDSVAAMRELNQAVEGINASFLLVLAGREEDADRRFRDNWILYRESLAKEQDNITEPGEQELVDRLAALSERYHRLGRDFFTGPAEARAALYFGQDKESGLAATYKEIEEVSGKILRMNEDSMKRAFRETQQLAQSSFLWYAGALATGVVLAVLLIGSMIRTIVYPIRAVRESALAIGAGNLDQVVPIASDDELGQLASAFNAMARQLREFRQSHHAQLIRAQQTSQATIDSFPDPVLVIDPQQRVEMANPAARRLLGVRPPEEGKAAVVFWEPPERLREPLAEVLQTQREYLPDGFSNAIVLQRGEQSHSYLPRVLPIRDATGTTLGAAVLLEDVTRFRLLDEVKSNLVATVSHELKTPLTSIRLVLHLLLEEKIGPLTPKQLELLVDARDNAERLLVMINNLLDLARLEEGRGQLRLRAERPSALLEAAADLVRPRAADRGVDLVLRVPGDLPMVAADAEQFQHALQNVLNNALAHTPSGGRITLAAEIHRRDAGATDKVVFSVSDTGSGISPEHLPFIFEKYYRVPGDPVPQGSGLGLAIVRQIVTAHGGTVECESCPGEQTVFRMALPVWTATGNSEDSWEAISQIAAGSASAAAAGPDEKGPP